MLKTQLLPDCPHLKDVDPIYLPSRAGDVRHSQADINKAQALLGYQPTHSVEDGLHEALRWYTADLLEVQSAAAVGSFSLTPVSSEKLTAVPTSVV